MEVCPKCDSNRIIFGISYYWCLERDCIYSLKTFKKPKIIEVSEVTKKYERK